MEQFAKTARILPELSIQRFNIKRILLSQKKNNENALISHQKVVTPKIFAPQKPCTIKPVQHLFQQKSCGSLKLYLNFEA